MKSSASKTAHARLKYCARLVYMPAGVPWSSRYSRHYKTHALICMRQIGAGVESHCGPRCHGGTTTRIRKRQRQTQTRRRPFCSCIWPWTSLQFQLASLRTILLENCNDPTYSIASSQRVPPESDGSLACFWAGLSSIWPRR